MTKLVQFKSKSNNLVDAHDKSVNVGC